MFWKKSSASPADVEAFTRESERMGFDVKSLAYSIVPSENSGANHFIGIGRHTAGVDAAYCLEIGGGEMRDGVILGAAAAASYRAIINDARMAGRGLIQHFRLMADRDPERYGPGSAVIRFLIDAAAIEEEARGVVDVRASARLFAASFGELLDRFDEGESTAAEFRREVFWRLSVTVEIGIENYQQGAITADQLIEWVRAIYDEET